MGLRVLFITVLLGSLLILQLYLRREPEHALYAVIVATYLLTIGYSVVFSRIGNLTLFSYVQVIGDVLLASGLIYITGGLDSPFSFLYILTILAAGFLLLRRGNFIVAAFAGICYGAIIDLQYYGIILSAPEKHFQESELIYHMFLYFFAFFSVALLSSSLAERLRTTREMLEEKSIGLQELQALNDSIVRSMADGMVTVGTDGLITGFNRAAEDITGMPFREVRGRSFTEVFDLVGIDTSYTELRQPDARPVRYETTFSRSGRLLVLGMTFQPLMNDKGEVTGLLGIFQDLTPIKEMEAEIKRKDRLAVIGELAAGMAHEIRNPLASLSGSLQVLRGGDGMGDEDRRLMDIALVETERLNSIVSEFLDYARPREPMRKLTDLSDMLADVESLVSNSSEFSDGVNFVLDLPEYNVMAVCDSGQIRQVLMNLANNAAQAIEGEGTVKMGIRDDGGGNAVIEVEDNGAGIPKGDLDKIFFPFFSTKPGGAGLGLSIVFRIIEDHGGRIRVESESGRGSKFTVILPKELGG